MVVCLRKKKKKTTTHKPLVKDQSKTYALLQSIPEVRQIVGRFYMKSFVTVLLVLTAIQSKCSFSSAWEPQS